MASPGSRRTLIIVENLPCPFDRRVWQEALALQSNGYEVSIICPVGRGFDARFEILDAIRIYRHPLPLEAKSAAGYAIEYTTALFWQAILSARIALTTGFDIIHACNPPDTIFLIALLFKPFGKRFLFDHHDINPELYEAKFRRRDKWYRLLLWLERCTFRSADASIATNESYRQIAIDRGGMRPDRVFVVRSGPDLARLRRTPPDESLRRGRRFLVGYVGVMGQQEGLDLLLHSVAKLRRAHGRDDIQFVLIGSGTERDALIALAGELGISDCVEFTGRVSDDDLWRILGSTDICVNPDRANAMNDKSTMNKIMEYMALGKPIVQFDLTEGRVSAAGASLYARPNDVDDLAVKIAQLLDDPEARARMAEIGSARVTGELAWHHQVPSLLRAYDKAFEVT